MGKPSKNVFLKLRQSDLNFYVYSPTCIFLIFILYLDLLLLNLLKRKGRAKQVSCLHFYEKRLPDQIIKKDWKIIWKIKKRPRLGVIQLNTKISSHRNQYIQKSIITGIMSWHYCQAVAHTDINNHLNNVMTLLSGSCTHRYQ